ncbi:MULTISPECIES: ferritin [Dietzia]|uniref:Ferritin n=1 Tax=Dietzia cinnamea TaxID=321318 RepID=A0AAW5Q5E0_9ACTN|nr:MULTISPECIES: ferritin [Dietzia]EFV90924.1 Ferritin Dps family protein [Dietzia cinnamea P4]KZO58522.1 bacterioferritin [Dietzia maris]AVM63557.1 bacterioferritin [Dietzia sp. oral taxon 368]MBB1020843.1 ferritin [Dietzia sp. E1]MBM7229456.1 ferritin [Dietzia cinnamea]
MARNKNTFVDLLSAQVGHEFAASQQYVAIAVWADAQDLPQLAGRFYSHSLGERNHAMMMVQYMLDRDIPVTIPAVPAPEARFSGPADALRLALEQEKQVTRQIEDMFQAARAESDPLGEQFMLWFLREQVEEVANMNTLVTIAERAADDWFRIEEYLARENDASTNTGTPPSVAGGAV